MTCAHNQRGFALITAIMILFAATILGLMVMNSSELETLLSGAQQRYEDNLNVAEGAATAEATAVGTSATVTNFNGGTRDYAVVDPETQDQILSPTTSSDALFDPGSDMTISTPYTVTLTSPETPADQWPMDNLLQSGAAANDSYDYHYRTVYRYAGSAPKGYDATKFAGYRFQISAQQTTRIDLGGTKVGPK